MQRTLVAITMFSDIFILVEKLTAEFLKWTVRSPLSSKPKNSSPFPKKPYNNIALQAQFCDLQQIDQLFQFTSQTIMTPPLPLLPALTIVLPSLVKMRE